MKIRILIADDHGVVRQGLRTFLSLSDDLEIVGEAVDGRQAIELAHRLHPDLVMMDLLMPGLDGVNATATIRRELPAVQVLALSGYLDDLPGGPPRLTRREEEVIVLLARGRANGQIARELHIAPQTVKTHVSNILSKLNSQSRTEAALHAMRVGLVPVHETAPR